MGPHHTWLDLQRAVGAVVSSHRDVPYAYVPLTAVPTKTRGRRGRLQPRPVSDSGDERETETAEKNDVSDLSSRVRVLSHIGELGHQQFEADVVVEGEEDVWRVCHRLETCVSEMAETRQFSIFLPRAAELSWRGWCQLVQSSLSSQRRGGVLRVCIEALGLPSVSVVESLTFGAGFDAVEIDYLGEEPKECLDVPRTLLLKEDLSYLALLCYRIETRQNKQMKCRTLASMLWLWLAADIEVGHSCPCLRCGLNAITLAVCDLLHRGIFTVNASAKKAAKACDRLTLLGRATEQHLTAFRTLAQLEFSAWTTPI